MAINDIVQTIADARVDARSLSEFVFKPAGFKVARRLAPPVDTLQFYINRFNSLNGDFSSSVSVALSSLNNSVAEADGKVAYIETTVQDAINNTAVEGGVLADTFVTMTAKANGGVARNLRNINSARFSVNDYGAVGDGVTDDGAAINRAIQACSDAGGGEVIFEPSRLGYASTLYSVLNNIKNVKINGNKQTLYTLDPTDTTNGSRSPFYISTGNSIEVFGFVFDGGYETYPTNAKRINNHNFAGQELTDLKIYNNVFKNCGYPTSASTDEAGDSIYIIRNSERVEIYQNVFINPARWAASFQFNTQSLSGIKIYNNVQLVTRPSNILGFVDLEFSSSADTVFSDVIIENNLVYFGCMMAMSNASFRDVVIRNNTFRGYTSTNPRVYKDTSYPYGFGLQIAPDSGRDNLKDITISNNIFDSVNKQNLEITFPSENMTISENTFLTQPDAPETCAFTKGINVKNCKNISVLNNTIVNRFLTSTTCLDVTSSSGTVSDNKVTALTSTAPCSFSSSDEKLKVYNNELQSQNSAFQFYLDGNVEFYDNTTPDGSSGRINTTLAYYGKNNTGLRTGDIDKATRKFFSNSKTSIHYAASTPTNGTKGDIIFNTAPTAGAPIGWVCTVTSATAATWLPFGVTQIAASYITTGTDARSLTASTATVTEVANTLATLIKDLKSAKVLS